LVWKAIESMTPMMSAIWREEVLMASIVCTISPTTAPPRRATCAADSARSLARWPCS